jgi:hypothetical protein
MWAPMGKLVPQLPGVVTFSYDLCFRDVIAHWKGILEEYMLCSQTLTLLQFDCGKPKNLLFRAQNRPGSTERCADMKNSKISQLD